MQQPDTIFIPGADTLLSGTANPVPPVFDTSQVAAQVIPGMHSLEAILNTPQLAPVWYFFFLFGLFIFFAWIRMTYGNILMQTYQAGINYNMAVRMFKDNSALQNQLDNVLYSLYFLSTAFFILQSEIRFGWYPFHMEGITLYLVNVLLLVAVFVSRIVLLNLAGFLFNRIPVFKEYLYNTFIFNKLLGILLLPFLVIMVYTRHWIHDVMFWSASAIIIIVILMRLTRGLIFSIRKGVLIFYMFLYLCALEIVPILLLFKWIISILR